MAREFRLTPETAKVLRELISKPGAERYGREIGAETGLKPSTVSPILARLEEAGFAESKLEDPAIAEREKRPRRRYYTPLVDSGESILDKLISQLDETKTEHKKTSRPAAKDSPLPASLDSGKSKWISSPASEKELGLPSLAERSKSADTVGNNIRLSEDSSDVKKPWHITEKK